MGKYDNVTMKEYMKKKKEMLDDLGRTGNECSSIRCSECPLKSCEGIEIVNPDKALERVMEYEPKVDWSKVEVDTKVLVKLYEQNSWCRRHFAKYENGKVYTYPTGLSSFTYETYVDGTLVPWNYAKLYKGDE